MFGKQAFSFSAASGQLTLEKEILSSMGFIWLNNKEEALVDLVFFTALLLN